MSLPEKNFDVIVIGGGHNGLVAAAYLAKAGRRVLLLEASDRLGGALATEDITPDYRISTGAQMIDMLPRRIEKDLKLAGHGLRYAARYVPTIALNPTNGHLVLSRRRRDIEVLRKKSARDADAYLAFSKRMKSYAALIAPFLDKAPFAPGQSAARSALRRLVWRGALLDAASREALLRDLPGSIGHMLDDAFETPILKGALAFDTLVGTAAGPYDAGTVLRGIYRKAQRLAGAGAWVPQGGLGAFVDALAAAAAGLGVTIEVSAPVARILVQGEAVVGVETAAGETFHAPQVLSSIHPRATLLDLLGANRLDAGLVARLSRIPTRGATAKLNLALSGLPTIQGLAPAEYGARLIVAPSLDDIQEAHAQAKRGTFASNPVMEVTFPSVADPTLAPVGHHVMSIAIQYVPYEAEGGWDDKRDRLIDRAVETLSIYAPDLKQRIVAGELLLPADLERKFGLAGGDWHQGELRPDRLLSFRPTPELAQYGTPVAGLFLCGAGSHPGGGVTGMAGRLAAEAALARRARA
ncbi:MAG: NAD(P)/FAD-dependent oxidoreductase [Parvibaculum sp.]|uniref:phytoene desaturase family protein n=1 Tax=Parvibaculum sp. TaxID=2024848 RepID=UPI00283FF9AF|nr:NAD(P)/FAD-dependent oxidoreductase [Parvibaculum sp.]MDR3500351.1 NAD(P)/FAD-dependent oxidoreductase [Parvibaculum sp.]